MPPVRPVSIKRSPFFAGVKRAGARARLYRLSALPRAPRNAITPRRTDQRAPAPPTAPPQ